MGVVGLRYTRENSCIHKKTRLFCSLTWTLSVHLQVSLEKRDVKSLEGKA